jgi:hypothetical protein
MAAGPHLGNCNGVVCRPTAPAADQKNAGWMPNAPQNFQSNTNGKFLTTFYDDLLSLDGYFSVIGRSVVLHNGTGARVGFCVIGRGDTAAVEAAAPLVSGTLNLIYLRLLHIFLCSATNALLDGALFLCVSLGVFSSSHCACPSPPGL